MLTNDPKGPLTARADTDSLPQEATGPTKRFPVTTVVFLVLGVGCLLATGLSAWGLNLAVLGLVPALLAEGGLIFLSALVVERSLLREFDHAAHTRTENLTGRVEVKIDSFFRQEFDDLKYADAYKIHLLPPRRSARNSDVTYNKIAEAIGRAKSIKVFCTSGIDIFPPPNTIPTAIVQMIRQKSQRNEAFKLTVLSCDPEGDYAKARGTLENNVNPNYLLRDIEDSQFSLLQIAQGAESEFTFSWYTYKFTPQAWFILTDTEGFVETYHFGLHRRADNDPNSCIGGRVPILQMTAFSDSWLAFNEYFDFLITPNKEPDIERLRTGFFGITPVDLKVPMKQSAQTS